MIQYWQFEIGWNRFFGYCGQNDQFLSNEKQEQDKGSTTHAYLMKRTRVSS